jgi:hypothetical protein
MDYKLETSLSSHRMRKWLVFILLVVTTAGIFIPCCSADNCCEQVGGTGTGQEKHPEEGNCSPFFACATCPGFVALFQPIQIVQPEIEIQVHHEQLLNCNLETYVASFWQPPRSC